MKVLKYIVFKVFAYFDSKNPKGAVSNTINFMVLLEASLAVPIFLILNGLMKFYTSPESTNTRMKYFIGLPLALILFVANTYILKKKLNESVIEMIRRTYSNRAQDALVWIIFLSPIVFVFVTPILYGAINGTLSFPFLESK